MALPFKSLHPDAQLPNKAGELEAAYDITCVTDERFLPHNCKLGLDNDMENPFIALKPGDSHMFHTGLSCAIPEGRGMFLWDKGGMGAKKKIHVLAGVIDCTYRGEWLVCLTNLSRDTRFIQAGHEIVQGHLALILPGDPVWVDELPESYRGEGKFGSTGR
jgi:dUTP pyrophosphatase